MKNVIGRICISLFFLYSFGQIWLVVAERSTNFFSPVYTEKTYKDLERAFNHSQYRVKENPGIIPDETVFSYASGAYLHGVDPIYINSEHTPLGKYLIAISILVFKNDSLPILVFGIFSVLAVWLLGRTVIKDPWLNMLPSAFLCLEKLFADQFRITPLLDIIQLPFILLTLFVFIREVRINRFVGTTLCVGLVMSMKTPIAGILLAGTCMVYMMLTQKIKGLIRFTAFIPFSLIPFVLSYTKTFMDGYSISQFIGFIKWIILYQQSKLEYPFSVWRLIYFNQWQTWWGNRSFLQATDWSITWPIFTTITIIVGLSVLFKKFNTTSALNVLLLWALGYSIFLSLGVVSSRFFLPLFPVLYIISVQGIYLVSKKIGARKK